MNKYIDAHCHLSNSESFSDLFARAKTMGVVGVVLNSVNQSDWSQILKIATDNKNICGCIGIHPWAVGDITPNWADDMKSIFDDNPNLMLGEVGLDKTRPDFTTQERIFIQSLEIAIKYKRVMSVHCVHAWDTMLHILKTYQNDLPTIVIHSFDGTQNALGWGDHLYFSYSPNITNPNHTKVISSISSVPKDKILIESDSHDIIPVLNTADTILSMRPDLTSNDIFNNTLGVFFNGQIA